MRMIRFGRPRRRRRGEVGDGVACLLWVVCFVFLVCLAFLGFEYKCSEVNRRFGASFVGQRRSVVPKAWCMGLLVVETLVRVPFVLSGWRVLTEVEVSLSSKREVGL